MYFFIGLTISSRAQNPPQEQTRLPQIKLEDYTIIGLEKVVLPRKERKTVFKKIGLSWSENENVRIKESPDISFRNPNKPGLSFAPTPLYVNALVEYGSFNTLGARADLKYSNGNVVPFVGVDFRNSDGHVKNAEYTRTDINGGLEGQAWKNSVFQLIGGYSKDEQSLWSSLFPPDSSAKKKATTWNWQADLDQQLSEQFSIFATGQFEKSDLENRFKYTQDLVSVGAGGIFSGGNTSILVSGDLAHNKSEREVDASKPFAAAFSWQTEYSMYSGKLKASQKIGNLSLSAGANAQHLKVEKSTDSKTYFYPLGGIAFNAQNKFCFSVNYGPGLEFQSMGQMLRAYEIADFGSAQPLKSRHRVTGLLHLNASPNLRFDISSDYGEFENFPVLYSSYVDTSISGFLTLNYVYPYWEYRYIDNAKIWESSFRAVLKLPKQFLLEGWLTYRWNEIATNDERGKAVSGNEIPYLPLISALAKIEWYFLANHKLQITGEYAGERFNDVANSLKLKDYFLIGAMLNIALTKQISLRFFGNNLLDQRYELFHTYSAPGVSGGGGIEIKL